MGRIGQLAVGQANRDAIPRFEIKPTAVVGKDAPVLPFELSSKDR